MSSLDINPLMYRFVRYCLNRAYLGLDDSKLSADDRYSLETILSLIRQAEDGWRDVNDVINFIENELPSIYKEALERLPSDIVDKLFETTLNNCKELNEVSSNPNIINAIDNALSKLDEIKSEFIKEPKKRIYEPST